MAQFAHVVTVNTTTASFAPPSDSDSYVRIENLDASNDVWVKGNGAGSATVEGDNCVRIRPNQSIYFRRMSTYPMISVGAAVKVLMESSNGRE